MGGWLSRVGLIISLHLWVQECSQDAVLKIALGLIVRLLHYSFRHRRCHEVFCPRGLIGDYLRRQMNTFGIAECHIFYRCVRSESTVLACQSIWARFTFWNSSVTDINHVR